MDRGRRSSRNVPRQRSLLQRDWPGLRLHVPAQLPHKSSISSQISFLLFKEGLEPRSKLEQQRKQVFKADLEPLRYTRPLNHMYYDLSPLFVNLCAWLHLFLTQPCSHDEPSCFSQGSPQLRLWRLKCIGAKSSQSFFYRNLRTKGWQESAWAAPKPEPFSKRSYNEI